VIVALVMFAGIQPQTAPNVARAQEAVGESPDKNGPRLEWPAPPVGSFEASFPEPSSKNADAPGGAAASAAEASAPDQSSENFDGAPAIDLPMEARELPLPVPSLKNATESSLNYGASSDMAAALAAGGSLITCGASGNLNWTTTSGSFAVMRQCSMTVPQSGFVLISANGSVARSNGPYEAQFEIGIDSTAGDANIDRWVNVYNDTGDGSDESVALSVLKPVNPGSHTFYFLGKRYAGSGTVLVYDPTLTVIYLPAANATALSCGASGNLNWTTTAGSFAVVRQCSLTAPRAGWVFISADGSLARQNGEYEAQFEIGIDSPAGDATIDRWVNVYNDSGDGSDRSVALSVLKHVGAGSHTFYFLGKRYAGSGTVLVYDPTLTAIYVPLASPTALSCGASGNLNWTTTASSFAVVRQCNLTAPQAGWVFISADGSLARQNGEYEAQFEIGIDSTAGDANIDRWVNVYNDSGDGTDKSVALSVLKNINAGNHTFYFLGKRYAGSGTVLVYDPTLTVIGPGTLVVPKAFLPIVSRHY
jgi:riboflavin biosynthesis pyrimidine reductase